MLVTKCYVHDGTNRVVCIWYYVHVGYAVLCIYDAMYMLDMQCYVQVVLRACGTFLLCTYGVVCMIVQEVSCVWCYVHIVQVALCACGAMYMSCMWRYVHVVSRTCRACGTMYMWYCVRIV